VVITKAQETVFRFDLVKWRLCRHRYVSAAFGVLKALHLLPFYLRTPNQIIPNRFSHSLTEVRKQYF
jgi:hypothetical protein